ncbi:MAG: helix-turn-helix domain-containing protein, partial [Pseudomonadota bacterium]
MLLDGIVAVCARRGLDSATVQEVTRHSGLAQGTFYNHFVDREALIVEAAKAILVGVHLKIGQRVRGMPAGIHRMVVAIDSTISEAVVLPDHGKLLSETIGRYPAITDEVRPALRADMRAGRRSGQMHVRASRLLDEQIGALIGLAIRLRLSGNTKGAINRSTC